MQRSAGPYPILLDQCHAEECRSLSYTVGTVHAEECRSLSYTVGSVPCRGVQVPILYCWISAMQRSASPYPILLGQCHAEECRSLSYTIGTSAMQMSAGPYPILLEPVPC